MALATERLQPLTKHRYRLGLPILCRCLASSLAMTMTQHRPSRLLTLVGHPCRPTPTLSSSKSMPHLHHLWDHYRAVSIFPKDWKLPCRMVSALMLLLSILPPLDHGFGPMKKKLRQSWLISTLSILARSLCLPNGRTNTFSAVRSEC